jgi:hypothetical protein
MLRRSHGTDKGFKKLKPFFLFRVLHTTATETRRLCSKESIEFLYQAKSKYVCEKRFVWVFLNRNLVLSQHQIDAFGYQLSGRTYAGDVFLRIADGY